MFNQVMAAAFVKQRLGVTLVSNLVLRPKRNDTRTLAQSFTDWNAASAATEEVPLRDVVGLMSRAKRFVYVMGSTNLY